MSWTQGGSAKSLDLIASASLSNEASLIDVGSGQSVLIGQLLSRGFQNITVLDISKAALNNARALLGEKSDIPTWLVADVLTAELPRETFDLWHDRAVFHFLTEADDRRAYVTKLRESLKPNGLAIIATFSLSGPEKCSGLPVRRYSSETLTLELGSDFELVASANENHSTPWGKGQDFIYCVFKRLR